MNIDIKTDHTQYVDLLEIYPIILHDNPLRQKVNTESMTNDAYPITTICDLGIAY